MSTVNISYGTRTEYPNDSNLNGLTSSAAAPIGGVTNTSSPAVGFKIDATLYVSSTNTTSTGTISFLLVESLDGTNYVDNVTITSSTFATASIKNARTIYVASSYVTTTSTPIRVAFDLPAQFAPKYHTLLISNAALSPLLSTSNSVYYTPILYTVA